MAKELLLRIFCLWKPMDSMVAQSENQYKDEKHSLLNSLVMVTGEKISLSVLSGLGEVSEHCGRKSQMLLEK